MTSLKYAPVSGDSQTDTFGTVCRPARTHPYRLQRYLELRGATSIRTMSFGTSGETTANLLDRMHQNFRFVGAPWGDPNTVPMPFAVIYAGVNDSNSAINQAGTQKNIEAWVMAHKHGAFGMWEPATGGRGINPIGPAYVATVSALPSDGKVGERIVVLSDTESTSGYAADTTLVSLGRQAANVAAPSVSGAVTVWEWRTGRVGKSGWGRVVNSSAATPTFCKRVVVVSTNYLNWTTGGDTPTGGVPGALPYSNYPAVRTAAAAAVTAQQNPSSGARAADPWVIYTDLFGYQKALIAAGEVPDFSSTAYDATLDWHYTQNNQHHNAYGHDIIAKAILSGGPAGTAFPAQWITDLSA